MSWVQQSTAAPPSNLQQSNKSITQAQYQHQTPPTPPQQQHQLSQQHQTPQMQTTNTTPAFSGKTALNQTTLPPPPPPTAKHFQNHVQQTQATHYNSLPKVPPQQQFKSSPLQQQAQQHQQQQQPTYPWQYQPEQQTYQANNNSAMQPKPVNNWPQNNATPQMNASQQNNSQQNVSSWPNASQPQYQQQQPQTNMYENYFAPEQTLQPTPQQQQQYFQQPDLNAIDEQRTTQQHFNFNDHHDNRNNSNINANIVANNNNVNNSKTNDSWGEWGDWNDNNIMNSSDLQQQPQQPKQDQQQQQQSHFNASVIEDSFSVHQNSNQDNWQWNMSENVAAATLVPTNIGVEKATVATTTQVPSQQQQQQQQQQLHPTLPNQQQTIQQNFQVPNAMQPQQQAVQQQQQSVDFSVVTSKTATISNISSIKPPNTLALSTVADNNFTNLNPATATNIPNNNNNNNNIPNSVYVSQAKPVTRPPRQYASPPTGNTPLEAPESSALLATPPQAFQNDESIMPPPPPPPTIPVGVATTANANPFKRAGAVRHHRAELMAATSFELPPPPPADFANPSTLNLEPDNSEILHENQEVIAATLPTNITLPNTERNQYMQTSHLSENQDEEFNLEADSLPPPGLSRLVLGEPELEATQRLVTGTEEPPIGNASTSHIDMEERHADGEDNSVEQTLNVAATNVVANRVAAAEISADRNLYQVLGESNVNNDRRVVTGLETAESITLSVAPSTATPIRSDQREIELDGENLEDQQIVSSRNEPPLEGAVANGAAVLAPPQNHEFNVEARQHHQHSHQTKASQSQKTQSNASTGNDSELELSEHHQHNQRLKSTRHGSNRNLDTDRRRDKQRSMERSLGSEEASEEYSSERERERRRGFREGSARSDERRDNRDRDNQRHRREKRIELNDDKTHEKYYSDRRKDRKDGDRHRRYNRYDADETEESQPSRHDVSAANVSSRKEYARRSMRVHRDAPDDRSDRDYDDRYDRTQKRSKREKDLDRSERRDDERGDRREKHGTRRADRTDRDDFDTTIERRRRNGRGGGEKQLYPRDYEEYRKQSSRNARDSDLEKEKRHPRSGNNPQIPDSRFDPRLMYGYPTTGQYGMDYYYYEHLARTNPKAYNEYYKKYYEQQQAMAAMSGQTDNSITATLGDSVSSNAAVVGGGSSLAATDGRESVHSGRSSAHNEKDRSNPISSRDAERQAMEHQRSTPCKFASLHAVVSLSSGILVTVRPKLTSKGHLNNTVKLQRLGINDAVRHLYQSFPGPLVRGLTHKKTIIDFCEDQIRLGPTETTIYARQLTPRSVEKYRASYTLMWNLLVLLLRQNGMVVGTDIAELLLQNQQQFPYNSTENASSRRINSTSDDDDDDASLESLDGCAKDDNEIKEKTPDDVVLDEKPENLGNNKEEISDATNSQPTTLLTEVEITDVFRNYLLYGNVNEALDWATDNNLWGHALFLASKVDRRSHANVMMKFANKLALNDPLQTLYQLMSGRTPSSVTSVNDEKWGDWRPHLSMILSNTSLKPELDRKAITTLGDSLFNRGDLYAAHFCYLMAQVGFGRYQESAVQETTLQQNLPKLVLLGSSHYKSFASFATNEAIMMTEIYEYACSLNDEKFSLIEFQPYKYLLATRLLDYGFHLKSLMYMEQIALHIVKDPSQYEPSFINKVYEIADRLKYFDPALEKTLDDQQQSQDDNSNAEMPSTLPQNVEEQKWLQSLRSIALQYKLDYPIPTSSYPSNEYMQQQQQPQQQDPNYLQTQINQEFAEINKQFSELNLQYTSGSVAEPALYNTENVASQPQHQNIQETIEHHQQQEYNQFPTATTTNIQQGYNDYEHAGATQQSLGDGTNVDAYGNYIQQQQGSYYDPNAQQTYDAYAQQQNVAGYGGDYWAQQQQQIGDENARPTISMPKSKTYDSDDEQKRRIQQNSAGINNQQQVKKNGNVAQQNKSDAKDLSKSTQQGNQNSGWFGGIWNKLSLKPKNQMILPDDKNPTIVWDAEKKRWVNTDGEEANEENVKPPPKMSEIMPQAPPQLQPMQQQPQVLMQQQQLPMQQLPIADSNAMQPMTVPLASSSPFTNYSASAGVPNTATNTSAGASKPPSLQSNMFKMQRNRTLKNSYVDVFNPSGAPMSKAAENVLAPVLPPSTVPSGGFFVPDSSAGGGSGVGTGNESANYQQQQQQQHQETPQFYNPNQFSNTGY